MKLTHEMLVLIFSWMTRFGTGQTKPIDINLPSINPPPIVNIQLTKNEYYKGDNYKDYKILVKWFPYDSIANEVYNYRYSSVGKDIIETFICENGAVNVNLRSPTHDWWICQLNKNVWTNLKWINDPRRWEWEFQKNACLDKWNAVQRKTIRICYNIRKKFQNRFIYLNTL